MLIWVPSDAVKFVTSTNESLSESVTELVVELFEFQTPTSTTSRSPVATLAPVVTAMLLCDDPCALACWMKAGDAAAKAAGAVASATVPPASSAIAYAATDRRRGRPQARAPGVTVLASIDGPPVSCRLHGVVGHRDGWTCCPSINMDR
jgi:hypothetical protein